jgi:flagellar biosynthesis GTPase FlhF
MKLFRFTALDTQRAMIKINEVLGADALIYSTRKIPYGIEMIVGPANDMAEENNNGQVQLESGESNRELIDKLNIQLQFMNESIQRLSMQIAFQNEKSSLSTYQKWISKLKNLNIFKKPLREGTYEGHSLR